MSPGGFVKASLPPAPQPRPGPLDRFPGALRTFTTAFGAPNMSVAQFTTTHAAHVQIPDLRDLLPASVTALLQ